MWNTQTVRILVPCVGEFQLLNWVKRKCLLMYDNWEVGVSMLMLHIPKAVAHSLAHLFEILLKINSCVELIGQYNKAIMLGHIVWIMGLCRVHDVVTVRGPSHFVFLDAVTKFVDGFCFKQFDAKRVTNAAPVCHWIADDNSRTLFLSFLY